MTGSIQSAATLSADLDTDCDVCVIGSGAGGATVAAGLAERGLSVVILEEGGHRTRADFKGNEGDNVPMLYQERGARATADLAVSILQGRTVGGGTTVNWTTCFRTPDRIFAHWADRYGMPYSAAAFEPHFAAIEERLNIAPWQEERVNENNRVLLEGARRLGMEASILRRNVRGCADSGQCGTGCPYDAKQSMLVTYVQDAVGAGARLFVNARAERIEVANGRAVAVHAVAMEDHRDRATARRLVIRPRVVVAAGGAINSPALLLRSGLTEGPVGLRTMLHPVVAITGDYPQPIEGWAGAPQSVASHAHIDRGPDRVGYFLETAPIQPMLAATAMPVFGTAQRDRMRTLGHVASLIAVCADGLTPEETGGRVSLRADGRIRVDYPIGPALVEAWRDAHRTLARLHFAAGATRAASMHLEPVLMNSEADLPLLDAAPYGALRHAVFSAHQLGGCVFGRDAETSVVDPDLRHWHVGNLFVVDGSVFPTGLGVNPSESIYAFAHRAREAIAAAV
jgi:choline dehydrogenase-like flavoprotein